MLQEKTQNIEVMTNYKQNKVIFILTGSITLLLLSCISLGIMGFIVTVIFYSLSFLITFILDWSILKSITIIDVMDPPSRFKCIRAFKCIESFMDKKSITFIFNLVIYLIKVVSVIFILILFFLLLLTVNTLFSQLSYAAYILIANLLGSALYGLWSTTENVNLNKFSRIITHHMNKFLNGKKVIEQKIYKINNKKCNDH